MARQRVHREWFRPVERGGRKSCPTCRAKLPQGEWIWSWGEYVRGKWHNVKDVCVNCWPDVRKELVAHRSGCGCAFQLVGRYGGLPEWMTLEEVETCPA